MTSTTLLPLAGLGVGIGAALLLFGLFGGGRTLTDQLARLDPFAAGDSLAADGSVVALNRRARLGTAILAAISRFIPLAASSKADLAVVGTPAPAHAARVAPAAIAGTAAAPALAVLAVMAGIRVPVEIPLAGCIALGAAAALLPVVNLRRRAAAGRRAFRQALACWLELVALAQAAGMGIESALQTASVISDDERFERIRRVLESARHAGRTPWAGLSQLGDELAIPDLVELGATLSLAGVEGAKIRGSLAARAVALRHKELSEAEADANATTERLFLPSIVLMLGFLLFVGYPAVVTLTRAI